MFVEKQTKVVIQLLENLDVQISDSYEYAAIENEEMTVITWLSQFSWSYKLDPTLVFSQIMVTVHVIRKTVMWD